MAQEIRPFDGAPLANALSWSRLFAPQRGAGVVGATDLTPTAKPSTNRVVSLSAGTVQSPSVYCREDAAVDATACAANVSAFNRLDYIVAEFNWSAQTVTYKPVQGTPAATPQRPTLTQNDGVLWQEPLALVTVIPGVGAFSAGHVQDIRRRTTKFYGSYQRDADLPAAGNLAGPGVALAADGLRVTDGTSWRLYLSDGAFRVARNAALNLSVDGWNGLNFDTADLSDDVTLVTDGGYWTAPRNGYVMFSGRTSIYFASGPSHAARMMCSLAYSTGGVWTELKRGTDSGVFTAIATDVRDGSISTMCVVTGGIRYSMRVYIDAVGLTKQVEASAVGTYFDGFYI